MLRTLPALFLLGPLLAAPVPLFDGKSLAGWEGNKDVWRVENGTITGGSLEGNPKNEFLVSEKAYKNFVLRFEYKLTGTEGFVNGGVQFHSQRIDNPPNEMIGYQADIGAKFTGFLYDESRRKKILAPADEKLVASIEKPGDWNTYEIRAEGDRIRLSVNGTQTISYTEPDPKIPLTGKLGLQIHGDCKAVISFRNITIDTLPDDLPPDQSQILGRFGNPALAAAKPAPWTDGRFVIADNETIVFAGQENLVREQKAGTLEATLTMLNAAKKPIFRPMAWEADTVYEQWRDLNFGSWESQLRGVGATAVICQFGQMESLDGPDKIPAFTAAYHRLLDQFAAVTPRIVLLSPTPFEKPLAPHAPDLSKRNADLKAYTEAIRAIAKQRGAIFVDLLADFPAGQTRLTDNGVHLTPDGLESVALRIVNHLGAVDHMLPHAEILKAVTEKNRLWFDCWRPANWSFVYGDRIQWPFGKSAADSPSLRAAFEAHKPLIAARDADIHTLAAGKSLAGSAGLQTGVIPSPQPPITPEQQLAKFTLADGYQINLFADETLGVSKPVQFSWDEKGRLFVACSPTYPHTLPGHAPSDYILVLEDTDGDGKADKSHKFAEGLTMLQGLEPGDGGLYVCDFDQILHLTDTDGDGRADVKKVLLSGFGIGDTHQLVNSISYGPDGCLWFTQGLHAFSRVETPHGIARLDKAGVWKFNPRTLKLSAYFNGGAAGHNCWGVAFDDWFQPFHKSGDRPHGYYSLPGLIDLPDPDDYHSVANLFESSPKTTSLDIIGTKALPPEIQGHAVIGGYFGSVVELHQLIGDQSGFTSKQLPRLLTSADNSFRPVDVGVGPDGGIYLADWLNPVIGHYQASYADPRRDRSHGRIWRITHKVGQTFLSDHPLPKLAEMTIPQLLEQLKSPERWIRYQVRRILFAKPTDQIVPAIRTWLATLTTSPEQTPLILEAAAILEAHQQTENPAIALLLNSGDPRAIAYGLRNQHDRETLLKFAAHPNPRVRLEAIVASAGLTDPLAVTVPLTALDHPRDRFIDYAIRQAVKKLRPHWSPNMNAAGSLAGSAGLQTGVKLTPAQTAYLTPFLSAAPTTTHPGKLIYESLCLNCHQPEGKGLPGVYPPLTPNEWINGDPDRLIKILLHGLTGPLTVSGKEYGTTTPIPMPPMGLDDQQTADILTYVRTSFGNQSPAITADQVRKTRAATASRTTFWTPAELAK